ncbi:MAG TPA: hypothetical protein VK471_09530 [Solirubrobacterales bacterium]|nr:hypothetical protein [Solirubrobacterales bacterium]
MSPPPRQEIERKLERFAVETLVEESYDGSDPLSSGAVDSLGIEQLVEYVEEEFGVRLGDEEMAAQHFESIPALASFVDSKLRGATL